MGKGNDPNCGSVLAPAFSLDGEDDFLTGMTTVAEEMVAEAVIQAAQAEAVRSREEIYGEQFVHGNRKGLTFDPVVMDGDARNDRAVRFKDARAYAQELVDAINDLQAQLPDDIDPQVNQALLDVYTAAWSRATDNLTSYARLDTALLDRRMLRLAYSVANSPDGPRLGVALRGLLLRPVYQAGRYDRAVEFFDKQSRRHGATPLTGLQMITLMSIPANGHGPLHEAASPPDAGSPFDEVLILYQRLTEVRDDIDRVSATAKTQSAQQLATRFRAALTTKLTSVESSIRRRLTEAARNDEHGPLMIDEDAADLRSTWAGAALVIRHFGHGRENEEMMRNAEQASEQCVQAICATSDTRTFNAALLPTLRREEFETLFPAQTDDTSVRGVYMPALNAVVLSPGHAQMVCNPDFKPAKDDQYDSTDLLAVHLHEMAHASASNGRAAVTDPLECAISEGYAEEVTHRAIPAAQALHNATREQPLTYVPVEEESGYDVEWSMMREMLAAYGATQPDPDAGERVMLGQLSQQERMSSMLADWLLPDAPADTREDQLRHGMAQYLGGQPGPLRQMLSRMG